MVDNCSENETVLFADDSNTARAAIAKVLKSKYSLELASNGDQAWAQVKNNPAIVLVIADINMPDSNGFELLGKIRKSEDARIANLPVIVITGAENSAAAMSASLKLGATDFISKPFKGLDLLCRVNSYIKLNKRVRVLEAELTAEKTTGIYQLEQYELYARKWLSFANRHKTACSFGYIEIDVLSDIHSRHSKNVLRKIQDVIVERATNHLRIEDQFSQISANRFGLVLPATSQIKSQILIIRLVDAINVMSIEIAGSSYRLSAKAAVYIRNGLVEGEDFESIINEMDNAIARCKSYKSSNKIIVCGDKNSSKTTSELNDHGVISSDSLSHLLNGEYHKIIDGHAKELSEKLGPFMRYASELGS